MDFPDFRLDSPGIVTCKFLSMGFSTFSETAAYVRNIPYGRNSVKSKPENILTENCGTCSTKHALLKLLADENKFSQIILVIGLFKMNGENTAGISTILSEYGLSYLPEAHCYLKADKQVLDCTIAGSDYKLFEKDIIEETEIAPYQITVFKNDYHKNYLSGWLIENKLAYSPEELWDIREKCILALSK
jgi:hypothetical protein